MSDQIKPTEQDYSRDLHADLAIAEAPIGAPRGGVGLTVDAAEMERFWEWIGPHRVLSRADARTIVIARNRMAAPAAMRRAIEAETAILAYVDATNRQDIDDHHDATGWLWDLASQIRNARKGDEKT